LADFALAGIQEGFQAGQQAAAVKGEDRFPAVAGGHRRFAVGEGRSQPVRQVGGQERGIAGGGQNQGGGGNLEGGVEAGQRAGKTGDAVGDQPAPKQPVALGVAVAVDEDLAHLGADTAQDMGRQGLAVERLQSFIDTSQASGQSAGKDDGSDFFLRHNEGMIPYYWSEAIRQLADADPVMAALIGRYAGTGLCSRGDAFGTLARSIVGQQISVKAADAVWARFAAAVGTVSPAAVLAAGEAGLASSGLSRRKIEYMVDLAGHFAAGRIRPEHWADMADEAVIAELAAVRGIGRWTAEMFLIFNLLRPDVFPLDDLGLQRAIFDHYFGGEKQPRRVLAELGEGWRPWRTVATWYLWRSLDPLPVEY